MFAQKKVITYSLTKKDRKTIRKVWRKWVHIDVSDTSHYIVRDYYNPVVMHNGVNAEALEDLLVNIKPDIIEASVSSHAGDNFLDLYAKTILIHKYKNKGIGLNAISSYKRASNILDKAEKGVTGRPDAVLFRKDEERALYEKINEIRKAFTVKDDNKDYESLLIKLSDTKESTDNFFDNVVVNDENQDIKNNRLELLKMFCNTFDTFIDFSKLEGL